MQAVASPSIVLEIPEPSPSLNELLGRGHWSSYTACRRHWATLVMVAKLNARAPRDPLLGRAQVIIERIGPRELDHDNFVGGLKPVIDALKDNRLIADDSRQHIRLDAEQHFGRPAHTLIRILEIP